MMTIFSKHPTQKIMAVGLLAAALLCDAASAHAQTAPPLPANSPTTLPSGTATPASTTPNPSSSNSAASSSSTNDPSLALPLIFTYQGVLTDGSGNPLASGTTDLEFHLTDAQGKIVYAETQSVSVDRGLVAALIGNGVDPTTHAPHGGVAPELMRPDGARFLEVWHDGELMDTPLEIASVPYAMWSERALHVAPGSIDQTALAPQSIAWANFSDDAVAGLSHALFERDDFRTGLATAFDAAQSRVHASLSYSTATNVEDALRDLDRAIKSREEKNVSRAGDAMQGDLRFAVGDAETVRISAANGDFISTGDVVAKSATLSGDVTASGGKFNGDITAKNVNASDNVAAKSGNFSGDLTANGGKFGGDVAASNVKLTGDLSAKNATITGNIAVSGTVDGVDLSDHVAATTAHGANGAIVGKNDLIAAQTTLQTSIDQTKTALQEAFTQVENAFKTTIDQTKTNLQNSIVQTQQQLSTENSTLQNHISATTAHGSDGAVVGMNTLVSNIGQVNNAIAQTNTALADMGNAWASVLAAHAADTHTHGVSGEIVGTNNTQTLNNKVLGAPKLFGPIMKEPSIISVPISTSKDKNSIAEHHTQIVTWTGMERDVEQNLFTVTVPNYGGAFVSVRAMMFHEDVANAPPGPMWTGRYIWRTYTILGGNPMWGYGTKREPFPGKGVTVTELVNNLIEQKSDETSGDVTVKLSDDKFNIFFNWDGDRDFRTTVECVVEWDTWNLPDPTK